MSRVDGLGIFQDIFYLAKRLKNALAKEIGLDNKKAPVTGRGASLFHKV